jgi:hypothetical protein
MSFGVWKIWIWLSANVFQRFSEQPQGFLRRRAYVAAPPVSQADLAI